MTSKWHIIGTVWLFIVIMAAFFFNLELRSYKEKLAHDLDNYHRQIQTMIELSENQLIKLTLPNYTTLKRIQTITGDNLHQELLEFFLSLKDYNAYLDSVKFYRTNQEYLLSVSQNRIKKIYYIPSLMHHVANYKQRISTYSDSAGRMLYKIAVPVFENGGQELYGVIEYSFDTLFIIERINSVYLFRGAIDQVSKSNLYTLTPQDHKLFKHVDYTKKSPILSTIGDSTYVIDNDFLIKNYNDMILGKFTFAIDMTRSYKAYNDSLWHLVSSILVLLVFIFIILNYSYNSFIKNIKSANKKVYDLKERYELAMKGSNDGLWDWNIVNGTIYVSDLWKSMIGFESDNQSTLKNWFLLIHIQERKHLCNLMKEHLRGNSEFFVAEHRLKLQDGSYIWVLSKGKMILDSFGNPYRMVGYLTNIDNHKRTDLHFKLAKEKAEAANRAKSKFLAHMSHEIRTPLNAILGFLNILKETETDAEKISYLDTIQKSSDTLMAMINDVLDFAKIENQKMSLEKLPFNPHEDYHSLATVYHMKANEKNIELNLFIDPHLPFCVESFPMSIKQVLSNLLSNAIKFTKNNGRINFDIVYTSDKHIYFSIEDNGIGITEVQQKLIFNPFTQAEQSTTRKYGGTGLGITISNHLVQMMRGELKLVSEYGRGSMFYFSIPVDTCKEKQPLPVSIPFEKNLKVAIIYPEQMEHKAHIIRRYFDHFGVKKIVSFTSIEVFIKNCKSLENPEFDLITIHSQIKDFAILKQISKFSIATIIVKPTSFGSYQHQNTKNMAELVYPVTSTKLYDAIVDIVFGHKSINNEKSTEQIAQHLSGHILVAEDNEANQELMRITLQRIGLSCEIAKNGDIAVQYFIAANVDKSMKPFNLILMDVNMPLLDGIGATSAILKLESIHNLKHTPIIALTANAVKGDKERFLSAGMDNYLSKPIQKPKFISMIAPFLEKNLPNEDKNYHIDIPELAKTLDFDEDDIQMLLNLFMKNAISSLEKMKIAVENNDLDELHSSAHSIKGSSGNLRLKPIYELSQMIDELARHKKDADYKSMYEKLYNLITTMEGINIKDD